MGLIHICMMITGVIVFATYLYYGKGMLRQLFAAIVLALIFYILTFCLIGHNGSWKVFIWILMPILVFCCYRNLIEYIDQRMK